MLDADLLAVLRDAAAAVRRALDGLDDWGLAGTRSGQYRSDLAADEACLAVLDDAGQIAAWQQQMVGPSVSKSVIGRMNPMFVLSGTSLRSFIERVPLKRDIGWTGTTQPASDPHAGQPHGGEHRGGDADH